MPLKENLEALTKKYQGRLGPRLETEEYPDVDQIIEALLDFQKDLFKSNLEKFLIDPLAATTSIATTWFFLGLLYSHEFGTPSEVIRIFEKEP